MANAANPMSATRAMVMITSAWPERSLTRPSRRLIGILFSPASYWALDPHGGTVGNRLRSEKWHKRRDCIPERHRDPIAGISGSVGIIHIDLNQGFVGESEMTDDIGLNGAAITRVHRTIASAIARGIVQVADRE